MANITVDLEVFTGEFYDVEQEILDRAARLLMQDINDSQKIEKVIEGRVTDAITRKLQSVVNHAADTAIYQKTGSYGEKMGDPLSLTEYIRKYLNAPARNTGFGDQGKRTRLDQLVDECVGRTLSNELKKEIDTAKATIKAAVDGHMKDALAATLRKSLGLS